jgi:hypothetical protein
MANSNSDGSAHSVVPFDPAAEPRASIVIDAIANEDAPRVEAPKVDAPKPRAKAAAFASAKRSFAYWPVAAAIVLGAGGGFVGGATLTKRGNDTAELTKTTHELRTRLGALEQKAKEDANRPRAAIAAVAALKTEVDKAKAAAIAKSEQFAARLEKLDKDFSARSDKAEKETTARFEKIEKTLQTRDATATIRPLPSPAAPAVQATTPAPTPAVAAPMPPVKEHETAKPTARPRLPIGGYVLRDVRDGIAYVEGVGGLREVGPGDYLAGAGRVQRVERRAGQWVLVTTAGIIDQEAY